MAVDARRVIAHGVGAAVIAASIYYGFWGGEYSAFDLGRLAIQQEAEADRIARTRTEVDSLHTLIDRLENDPAAIEEVARERFGMIREGETLYRFVEVGADAAEPSAH